MIRRAVLGLIAGLAVAQSAQAQAIRRPARGSELRAELMDALRPSFEEATGGPVEFVVRKLAVFGPWAYAEVSAQRPGGGRIDWRRTRFRDEVAAGAFDPAASMALLRLGPGGWSVVELAFGPTDVAWIDWAERRDLPSRLFE